MLYDDELDGPRGPDPPRHRSPWPWPMRWLLHLLVVVVWGLVVIELLFGNATHCGEPMRRAQCGNNLKQIQLAIEAYGLKYGAFPPAYVADANGHRLHSWRALILPFLDPSEPIDYDFSEPWDGPHNIRLLDRIPSVYRCPEQQPFAMGATSYAAITGPGTMFPGSSSARRSDVKDGLENTLSIVEVTNVPIPWTAPLDLDIRTMSLEINDPKRPSIGSPHPGGAHVATADGRVRFVKEGASPRIRAMTTIDGGERVGADDL